MAELCARRRRLIENGNALPTAIIRVAHTAGTLFNNFRFIFIQPSRVDSISHSTARVCYYFIILIIVGTRGKMK